MSSNGSDLVVPVREPGTGGIEDGDTRTATVTEVTSREVDAKYLTDTTEDALYVDVELEDDENTQLGALLRQLGADLTQDTNVDIRDYLHPGVKLTFDVYMEEDEEGEEWPRCDKETIRPAGESPQPDVPSAQGSSEADSDDTGGSSDEGGSGSSGDDGERGDEMRVIEVVSAHEGKEESTVKQEIIGEDASLLPVYKELKSDGDIITTDEGQVLIG